MRKKNLIGVFALALAFSNQASSQDKDWNAQLNAATELADSPDKITEITRLAESAETVYDKVLAGFSLGVALGEAGRSGSAIPHLKAALALSRKSAPRNNKQHDAIFYQLMAALSKAGRIEEATQLSVEHVAQNDALLTEIWAKTDNGMVHRRSALICPHYMDGMFRTETENYSADGSDIGCGYKANVDDYQRFTLYFTFIRDDFNDDTAAHVNTRKQMARTASKSGGVLATDSVQLNFKSPDGSPVYETVFRTDDGFTGAWTTISRGWILKTRITWAKTLGDDYGRRKTQSAFQLSTPNVGNHFKGCSDTPILADAPPAPQNGLEYLLLESLTDNTESKFKRPATECPSLFSTEGNAFVSSHLEGERIYTIDGNVVEGDVFVTPSSKVDDILNSEGNQTYILKKWETANATSPGTLTIFKAYEALPSAEQVFMDFAAAVNGETNPYGRIEYSEDGNTNIIVDPSSMIDKDNETNKED